MTQIGSANVRTVEGVAIGSMRTYADYVSQTAPRPAFRVVGARSESEYWTLWAQHARNGMLNYTFRAPSLLGRYAHMPTERLVERRSPSGNGWYMASRLFGVELEVEKKPSTSSDILSKIWNSMPGFVIVKSDGSLQNGFEIVTLPATLETHRAAWKPFLEGPASQLSSYRSVRCGMHVHVSAASIPLGVMSRVWAFVNRRQHEDYLSRVAGRPMTDKDSVTYHTRRDGKRVPYQVTNYYKTYPHINFTQVLKGSYDINRYSAINMVGNDSPTIEFRFFRGNTNPIGFMKNLEYIAALLEYFEHMPLRDNSASHMLHWVVNDAKWHYPNLVAWLKRHKVFLDRDSPTKFVPDAVAIAQSHPSKPSQMVAA